MHSVQTQNKRLCTVMDFHLGIFVYPSNVCSASLRTRRKLIQNFLLHICCDSFGCKYRSNITGIIYNNEMGDFSTPGQPNPDDIPPSKSNFIKPGKRPQSSISPVIFTDRSGRVRLVAGASGGPHITTAVSLVSNLR